MKKLLFVFFVLAVVMGSISLHAQHFSMTNDDEREIPLFPESSKEGEGDMHPPSIINRTT